MVEEHRMPATRRSSAVRRQLRGGRRRGSWCGGGRRRCGRNAGSRAGAAVGVGRVSAGGVQAGQRVVRQFGYICRSRCQAPAGSPADTWVRSGADPAPASGCKRGVGNVPGRSWDLRQLSAIVDAPEQVGLFATARPGSNLDAAHDNHGPVGGTDVVVVADHPCRRRSRPGQAGPPPRQREQASRDRGRAGGSGWGTTGLATGVPGAMTEARPAAVLGGAIRLSSSPETAPAMMGWVWLP